MDAVTTADTQTRTEVAQIVGSETSVQYTRNTHVKKKHCALYFSTPEWAIEKIH